MFVLLVVVLCTAFMCGVCVCKYERVRRHNCNVPFCYYIMIMKNGFRTFLSAKSEREISLALTLARRASVIDDISGVCKRAIVVFAPKTILSAHAFAHAERKSQKRRKNRTYAENRYQISWDMVCTLTMRRDKIRMLLLFWPIAIVFRLLWAYWEWKCDLAAWKKHLFERLS